MATTPARWQRRRAHELVAADADLVAGHSAHVFRGIEPVRADLPFSTSATHSTTTPSISHGATTSAFLALWHPRSDPELELIGLELGFCETRLAHGPAADWIAARVRPARHAEGVAS